MTIPLTRHLEKVHSCQESDFRWSSLRKLIKKDIRGPRILDAGCGTGHLSLELLEDYHDVSSIDNSEELVRLARANIHKKNPDASVMTADLSELKDKGLLPFDSIICLDVLEHAEDDRRILRSFHAMLKADGVMILSVPALMYMYGERDRLLGHYRRYERRELASLMEAEGFTIREIRYWNIIGLGAVLFFEKLLHRPVNETIRYDRQSVARKFFNPFLSFWFLVIENNIRFPRGLTLLVVCNKRRENTFMISGG